MRAAFLILIAGAVSIAMGAVTWSNGLWFIGVPAVIIGAAMFILGLVQAMVASRSAMPTEPSRFEGLDLSRQNELLRGTSMHLRDMRYRYSVHADNTGRAAFTREVNTITLGFMPVMILDNLSDRQGEGYVAFPFDGARWRGPGLPCAGSPDEAIDHAAKCISPLEADDDEAQGGPSG